MEQNKSELTAAKRKKMSEDSKNETSATTQTCIFVKQDETKENCPGYRENCPDWEKLPYPASVEIFRHLSDADRIKMAQVCRKFKNVFKDPSLWRKRKFIIDGKSDKRHILFTSIFGGYLQDVRLDVWHEKPNSHRNISETFEILMENLKTARLLQFETRYLELNRFRKFPELRDSITSCLNKIFETKTDLKKLRLWGCHFTQSTGTKVMDIIATSLGHGLEYIYLTEFLHKILNVSDLEIFKETFKKFSNLKHIGINYSYISDDLLSHWADSLSNKLESMNLSAEDREPHLHTISTSTWRKLRKSCPKLQVHFSTEGITEAKKILNLLQPNVPLNSFLMIANMRNAQKYLELSLILKHLVTCFKDSLDDVALSFGEMDYTPDKELVCLIERCHKVQSFHYLGNCGIAVPNAICESLKDTDSALYKVAISICSAEFDPEMEEKIKLIHVVLDQFD